ncbi:KCNB1 [Lepeophtheirus salmonis]|uniref:KCNB1 n=1 Tax=Lepeophtheirus salmonis TaxID=72036 RepID=A0A7R8H5W4_LEPSM|nr:KCNB1 [Lepeophtheirus salmonis]CAF2874874.1 KCNB1 [Lepeophtheirus salmonis]
MNELSRNSSPEPPPYLISEDPSAKVKSSLKLSELIETPVEKHLPTVILNIGGLKHQILWKNLEKISRASNILEIESLCDVLVDHKISEIFFDRNPTTMGLILGFYRTGILHVDDTICPLAYSDDLKYWQINEIHIDPCCLIKFNVRRERVLEESGKLIEEDSDSSTSSQHEERFVSDTKRKIWYIMEKPYTSTLAKVMNIVSISFIIVSLIGMVLSTTHYFHVRNEKGELIEDNYPLNIIEAVCVIWFTIEYVVRFACCPNRIKFIKGFLNCVDLLAIVPYYITLVLIKYSGESFNDVKRALHVLRAMRIIRVVKLAHHSIGLKLLGYTFHKSSNALGLILMLMGIIMFIFSNLIYFAEKDVNYNFANSIESFWWATITMTTVGYGDVVPITPIGKVLGSLCAISGILSLTLPIPILSRSFQFFYREKMLKKRSYKPVHQYNFNHFD